MEVHASVIQLKPGSLPRVREWADTIERRKEEALATLRDEGVQLESWFLFSRNGEDFLIAFMRTESMEKAKRAVAKSPHEIDAYHQKFKADTFAGGQAAELLVDLELPQGG